MKKRKKLLMMILAISLISTLLIGCGRSSNQKPDESGSAQTQEPDSDDKNDSTDNNGESEDANWDGEVSKIVVTYLTTGVVPADIDAVLAKVNEMTVPKIGVEVEFKTVSIFESMSQYPLWIGTGEELDVAIVAFSNISSYVEQGMLEPLDDLIANNAPYVEGLGKELPIHEAAVINDETYGITVIPQVYGAAGGFLITKESLDVADLSYEPNTKVTLEELGEIFAKIKETNPDVYPAGLYGSLPSFGYTTAVDLLGASASSGGIIGTESTTVENIYASDEYYEYLKHVRDWYEKGYIPRDAATAEATLTENLKAGVISGYFTEGQPNFAPDVSKDSGKEIIQLDIIDPYLRSTASVSSVYFTIPITSSDPDAAMRFINMVYENADLSNLIQFGIEDEHYVMVDSEMGLIDFPEGIDPTTSGFYNPMGLWGDQRNYFIRDEASSQENLVAFSDRALTNPTKAVSFTYDSSAMTNQIIAIDAVVNEYRAALETGSADLDSAYNEFITKLEANGINEVIADKQAQFDAWLAEQ